MRALFLGLLLMCAQTLAHAHDVLHDLASEPDICATCSVGGSLKAPAASTTSIIIPRPAAFAPTIADTPGSVVVTLQTPEARAPPKHA